MLKKKISFLCTTLLTSVSSVWAAAEAPALKITGFTAINGIFSHQGTAENGKGGTQPHFGIGASNLYFTATGKSSSGLEYKARIVFDAYAEAEPLVSQNYIEVLGKFGTVQFGNLNGPCGTMPESALNLIGGSGSIDGSFDSAYNISEGVISGVSNSIDPKKSTKIVLYSPDLGNDAMGYFQLGVAYTPNTSLRGRAEMNNASVTQNMAYMGNVYTDKKYAPFGLRNTTVGVKYKKDFKGFDIALAAVGVTERSVGYDKISVQNGRAYNLTAALGIKRWRFATGYLNNFNSRLPRYSQSNTTSIGSQAQYANTNAASGNAGKAWNFGGSYTIGAYQFAAGYFNTNRKTDSVNKATSDIYTATVDFTALEGLKLYAEMDYCITKTNSQVVSDHQAMYKAASKNKTAIANNRGTLFILGTKVSF